MISRAVYRTWKTKICSIGSKHKIFVTIFWHSFFCCTCNALRLQYVNHNIMRDYSNAYYSVFELILVSILQTWANTHPWSWSHPQESCSHWASAVGQPAAASEWGSVPKAQYGMGCDIHFSWSLCMCLSKSGSQMEVYQLTVYTWEKKGYLFCILAPTCTTC